MVPGTKGAPMTTADGADEGLIYAVVRNDEEQYSIWPDDRPVPLGWAKTGAAGPKQECMDYIDKVWTDMRPRSLKLRTE
jgi:MbtH protein